jgi:hypothetical protein
MRDSVSINKEEVVVEEEERKSSKLQGNVQFIEVESMPKALQVVIPSRNSANIKISGHKTLFLPTL